MQNRTGTWKVATATVDVLEELLNGLARDGYDVFSVLQVGSSEPLSIVPREQKPLERRTTFAVVAWHAPA
jgi:hypothetical protein